MKKIIIFIIVFLISQSNLYAGQYSNKFANCLIKNTTERDKIVLIRWITSAISQHPALQNEFNIENSKIKNHEIAVADYMQYILGTVCLKESKDVLNFEGIDSFGRAFELLGELAMQSLMKNKDVKHALENWVIYLDKDFIGNYFVE